MINEGGQLFRLHGLVLTQLVNEFVVADGTCLGLFEEDFPGLLAVTVKFAQILSVHRANQEVPIIHVLVFVEVTVIYDIFHGLEMLFIFRVFIGSNQFELLVQIIFHSFLNEYFVVKPEAFVQLVCS